MKKENWKIYKKENKLPQQFNRCRLFIKLNGNLIASDLCFEKDKCIVYNQKKEKIYTLNEKIFEYYKSNFNLINTSLLTYKEKKYYLCGYDDEKELIYIKILNVETNEFELEETINLIEVSNAPLAKSAKGKIIRETIDKLTDQEDIKDIIKSIKIKLIELKIKRRV